mmetsp:Transcript_9748/g.29620  ORF Transcript_9748/g.29620 Transcript_9748/m.29620 type:complete len:101 (-) Transcript_9748:639-941(-)
MGAICIGGPQKCGSGRNKRAHLPKSSSESDVPAETHSWPQITGVTSFGLMAGLCAGVFVRKIGPATAITCGGLIALFQLAASRGYISGNWRKAPAYSGLL